MGVAQLLRSQGPCNAGYAGVLVAIFTGDMVLLGFFSSLWKLCPNED